MASFNSPLSCDIILFTSLLYWIVDLQESMNDFSGCHWPLYRWLLISYVLVIASRVINIVGDTATPKQRGDFLLNMRHSNLVPRVLAKVMWALVVPCFAIWTLLGSVWIVDSKRRSSECLPPSVTSFFVISWHILCYAWILLHMFAGFCALSLERRLRNAESDVRQIENDDMRVRWGRVSRLPDYDSVPNDEVSRLTPAEIKALPEKLASNADLESECSICLEGLNLGDRVREVGACGHTFHCSCIDLWLLRCAHCPLCKRDVKMANGNPDNV